MKSLELDHSLRYLNGTYRVLSEEESLLKIGSVQSKVGVTRVAQITDLDRIGIPVHSVTRPSAARGAISVYSGKGVSDEQSRISAVMEAVERCLGEAPRNNADIKEPHFAGEQIVDSYSHLKGFENPVDPNELILPKPLSPETQLEWVRGWDLLTDEDVLVPANAVYHPYNPPSNVFRLFRSDTNGFAAGNYLEEAILHGLLEVVERDAYSIAEGTRETGSRIVLDPADGTPHTLFKRFTDAGVDVYLWYLPSETGIPTVLAALDDTALRDPALLVIGAGAHLDPAVAVNRALTEAAQSRLVQIHGAREDTEREMVMRRAGYTSVKRINRHWYNKMRETITLHEIENYAERRPCDNIRIALDRIARIARRAIIVNLTRESIEIPVIRTIIPGLEVSALDSTRIGPRVREQMKLGGKHLWKKRGG